MKQRKKRSGVSKKMTKQQQTSAPEVPTVDLLRKRFKMMDEFVESIRKDNLNAGVPSKYLDTLIQWRGDDFLEKKGLRTLLPKQLIKNDLDTSGKSRI
jgi:hypothetical protein